MKEPLLGRFFIWPLIFLLAGWSVGCSSSPPTNSMSVDTTPKFTSSRPIDSSTPSMLPTSQSELTLAQQQARIRELMIDNPDCYLPCWWGIKPGTTTWQEANNFLKSFATKIGYGTVGDKFSAFASFNNPPKEITSSHISLSFSGSREIIQTIKISGTDGVSSFLLPNLLGRYGPPSDVRINTFSSWMTTDNNPPFTMFLYYSQLGILAQYDLDGLIEGKMIRACAKPVSVIRLWFPQQTLSFSETLKIFDVSYDGVTLSSIDALGMDGEEFYQNYKNSDNPCFETPTMKWPGVNGSYPTP